MFTKNYLICKDDVSDKTCAVISCATYSKKCFTHYNIFCNKFYFRVNTCNMTCDHGTYACD